MKVLVIGGTGTVGSQVVRELLTRGVEVSVLTRSAEKAGKLPRGARGVIGDLLDPRAVRSVFTGQEGVFLLNPVSATETHEGLMALNGIRMAGVKRLAYLSVHNVDAAPHLPHFGSKIALEIALKASGVPVTILRPNNYYQNDYFFKDALQKFGVYPQPIGGVGVSRVDVRDLAEAAAIVLTTAGRHEGQTYNLVGPQPLTGTGTAEAWGRALGKPIAYAGDDLDAWEAQSLQYLPPWMVFDFRLMYAFFQKSGLKATGADIDRLTKLLGHPPRSFEDFAAETASAWRA
jgi:uncharacterized protein YbjT (DUF2867 family)